MVGRNAAIVASSTGDMLADAVNGHDVFNGTKLPLRALAVAVGWVIWLLVKFLEYIQTRIGRTFDDQELLALFLAYLTALSSLDSHHFVNELLKVRQ